MTKHRSDRPEQIVEVIADFTEEYGHSPSIREVMQRVGLASPSATLYHLTRLVNAGRLVQCRCGCGHFQVSA